MQDPEELFNLREAKREDYYSVMIVNEALKNYEHKNLFPWLLFIEIYIKEKTEQYELPTDEEAVILNIMEDKFTDLIKSCIPYQYIGRVTNSGTRKVYYYLQDPEKVHERMTALIEEGTYERAFEYSISNDPDWEKAYFFFNY